FPSPYNTYLNPGLPPGPIANPGQASLQAALRPALTDYLFFVANLEGGHIFSKSLSEHNVAVSQYRADLAAVKEAQKLAEAAAETAGESVAGKKIPDSKAAPSVKN